MQLTPLTVWTAPMQLTLSSEASSHELQITGKQPKRNRKTAVQFARYARHAHVVAEQRVAHVERVDPDLVGAAVVRPEPNQREVFEALLGPREADGAEHV